jgi:hypothetical protein
MSTSFFNHYCPIKIKGCFANAQHDSLSIVLTAVQCKIRFDLLPENL